MPIAQQGVQPDTPFLPDLPAGRPRGIRADQIQLVANISTSTLLMGGGAKTREVDAVTALRPSAIRGNLRFWWRALEGHKDEYREPKAFAETEAELWGGARGDNDKIGRSRVEVRVSIVKSTQVILDDVSYRDGAFYALWAAKQQTDGKKPAQRYAAGIEASLTIVCPSEQQESIRRVLKAWILFGGLGSRTRRGVGSLTCVDDGMLLDLSGVTSQAELTKRLNEHLGGVFFGAAGIAPRSFPLLAGARLVVAGDGTRNGRPEAFAGAERAWHKSLHWLRDFRQAENFARDPRPGRDNIPAGTSRWPEADKIRHRMGHAPYRRPVHTPDPAWPRAGFGLPIVGQFKRDDVRNGDAKDSKGVFQINWADDDGLLHDRLASPLIVKALPVRGGFLACSVWLNRGWPSGSIGLLDPNKKKLLAGSGAPFGGKVGPAHTPVLATKNRTFRFATSDVELQDAFMEWVLSRGDAWGVA